MTNSTNHPFGDAEDSDIAHQKQEDMRALALAYKRATYRELRLWWLPIARTIAKHRRIDIGNQLEAQGIDIAALTRNICSAFPLPRSGMGGFFR